MSKPDKNQQTQTAWRRAFEYALDRGNSEKAARFFADTHNAEFEGANHPTVDPDQAAVNRKNAIRAEEEAILIREAHAEGDGVVNDAILAGGLSTGQAPLTGNREQLVAQAKAILERYGVEN